MKMNYVGMRVSNLDRSFEFYEDLLGLREVRGQT
jgi:catechol 2,3-dioxygenase-like lactoylglutathione lyase family enzyme